MGAFCNLSAIPAQYQSVVIIEFAGFSSPLSLNFFLNRVGTEKGLSTCTSLLGEMGWRLCGWIRGVRDIKN